LEYIRQNYSGFSRQHAGTMIQLMWQADLHGIAKIVTECLGVYYSPGPDGGRHLISPKWLVEMYCFSP